MDENLKPLFGYTAAQRLQLIDDVLQIRGNPGLLLLRIHADLFTSMVELMQQEHESTELPKDMSDRLISLKFIADIFLDARPMVPTFQS